MVSYGNTFSGTSATFTGATGTSVVVNDQVTGDTVNRWQVDASGKMSWGSGSGAVDLDLYRSAAGVLKTDNNLAVAGTFTPVGTMTAQPAASGNVVLSVNVAGTDTFDRMRVDGNGTITLGPGTGARDVQYGRTAASTFGLTGCDLDIATAGRGVKVAEGSNAKQGTATLVAGTVTVANTSVTATSRIFLTAQSLGTVTAPKALAVTARTAGTSFTITSADNTDTSVVAWEIFEVG
jgi:hypothetical protein